MNEPVEIIEQYNSLDDILSSTAGALTTVAGHVDDLRKAAATSEAAANLLATILLEVDSICYQVKLLCATPDDQHIRTNWAQTANGLHDLGEEALILLSELEA